MGEWRPGQRDTGALGLGCARLGLRAADGRNRAFAARDALRRRVQIADRALAADRAVMAMRGCNAEAPGEELLRIAIAQAQEIAAVKGADLAEQFRAGVGLGAPERFLE